MRRTVSNTLKWPGHNRVQITCNTSDTHHVQHIRHSPCATHQTLTMCNTSDTHHVQHIRHSPRATHQTLTTCNTSDTHHVQHIRHSPRATHQTLTTCNTSDTPCATHQTLTVSDMPYATWYEGTAQLLSLTVYKSHLLQLYFIG